MIFENIDGRYRLAIDDQSKQALRHFLSELTTIIDQAKRTAPEALAPHLRRLFPVAYHDDAVLNDEYRRLTHEDLAESYLVALRDADAMLASTDDFGLDDLQSFVRSINALRLVLGTLLDVRDDAPDEPIDVSSEDLHDVVDENLRAQRELYDYLGWLLQSAIEQLT